MLNFNFKTKGYEKGRPQTANPDGGQRSTPARFGPGLCQCCGGEIVEHIEHGYFHSTPMMMYRKTCLDCHRTSIVRYGERYSGRRK